MPASKHADHNVSRGVSMAEFSVLNNISLGTVERLVRDGTIPSYKLGRARRIPLSYLEQLQQPKPRDAAVDAAIDEIVASAPALTPDQRNRISALLRAGSRGGAA